MTKWMRKALEDRDRWRRAKQLDSDKQHGDQTLIAEKARIYWNAFVATITADVDSYNADSSPDERLSHLSDQATGSVGFCRAQPFPEAELWLQPRESGVNCKLEITRTRESDPEIHHIFLEYIINPNSELVVRHHGLVLSEDQLMELLLGRLIFPLGRPT